MATNQSSKNKLYHFEPGNLQSPSTFLFRNCLSGEVKEALCRNYSATDTEDVSLVEKYQGSFQFTQYSFQISWIIENQVAKNGGSCL